MRPTRREFIQGCHALASVSLLSGCGLMPLPGQQRVGPRRIGYLRESASNESFEAFRDGMQDFGYVEGQNLIIEYRDPEGNFDRFPSLSAELVSIPVEVLVVGGALAARAAMQATTSIPIVVTGSNAAVSLVANIGRPEGNLTGVATNNVAGVGKWIELLKETVPTLAHLAAIADPSVQSSTLPAAVSNRAQVELASQALGLPYTWYDVRNLDQLPSVLSTAVADGADGLVVISGGVILGGTDPRIGSAVLRSRLPGVGDNRLFAVNGGLLAHGVETLALARRSAFYVDRILRGAKPADLPIELPTRFNIVINLRSALELGITVPQSVLARATEVIQ